MTNQNWQWWAGTNEEEYRLAGPCSSKDEAICDAYGSTEPGDKIFLVEAVAGEYNEYEDLHMFSAMRNQEIIVRAED